MTPNETANVTPNETANVMHMNSSLETNSCALSVCGLSFPSASGCDTGACVATPVSFHKLPYKILELFFQKFAIPSNLRHVALNLRHVAIPFPEIDYIICNLP